MSNAEVPSHMHLELQTIPPPSSPVLVPGHPAEPSALPLRGKSAAVADRNARATVRRLRPRVLGRFLPTSECLSLSGGFLFRLAALGAAQLFARQFFVERLAAIDANLTAFVFSAHTS